MPVLDSSLLIDAKRRPDEVAPVLERALAEDEALVVPIQAAIEYASGVADVNQAIRELGESFVVMPCDEPIAREAARIAQAAFKRGVFPGWADVQIAATAIHQGMYVITANRRHIRDALGARVWDYRSEPAPPG